MQQPIDLIQSDIQLQRYRLTFQLSPTQLRAVEERLAQLEQELAEQQRKSS